MLNITKYIYSLNKDVFWSITSTIIKTGGSVLLLPVILAKFSVKEIGLWFFFNSVGMFVLMIDAGFSATLTRNFRYVVSNSRIYKNGIDDHNQNSIIVTIEEMLYVSKKIYFYLALFSIFILSISTYFIIDLINKNSLTFNESLFAWLVYSIAMVLNLRYYYRGAVLNGLNKIALSQKIDILTLIINYLIVGILVFLNFGLISMTIGLLISMLLRIYLYNKKVKLIQKKIPSNKLKNIINLLWPNTWKTGLSNFLGYLIRYLSTFFIAFYLGLKVSGSYGLTFQIVLLIYSISNVWINTSYPLLNSYRIENSTLKFYNLFYINFKRGIYTYILLSILFLAFGNFILLMFNSNTKLLSFEFSFFILLHMFVDYITNVYGYLIMTGNKVPFLKSSLITVVLILILNFVFNELEFGMWGILSANFLAGLVYNYWYWIYNGYKEVIEIRNKNI